MVPNSAGEKASRTPAWGPNGVAAKNRAATITSPAITKSVENATTTAAMAALPKEDLEALEALSQEQRDVFRALHIQVADEARSGGARTRYSILKNFVHMTSEQMELCIELYTQHMERAVQAAAVATTAAATPPPPAEAAPSTPAVAPEEVPVTVAPPAKAPPPAPASLAQADLAHVQDTASSAVTSGYAGSEAAASTMPKAAPVAVPREWPARKPPVSATQPAAPTPTTSSTGAKEWPVRKHPAGAQQHQQQIPKAAPVGCAPVASSPPEVPAEPPVPPGLGLPPGLPSTDAGDAEDEGRRAGSPAPKLPPQPSGPAPIAPPSPPAPRTADHDSDALSLVAPALLTEVPPLQTDRDAGVAPSSSPPLPVKPGDAWVRKRVFQLRVQISADVLNSVLENLSVDDLVEPFTEVKMWLGLDEVEPLPAALAQLVTEYRAASIGVGGT